jgi:hypothetical protein
VGWDWVSPLGMSATNWPIVPAPNDDDDECGAVAGMRIGMGNRSTQRKPAPVPLWLPQIPYGSNQGRRGGKPATNRLNYDTASIPVLSVPWVHYCCMRSFGSSSSLCCNELPVAFLANASKKMHNKKNGGRIAQSDWRQDTGWTAWVRFLAMQDLSFLHGV